jgi:hypothetical protein
MMELPRRFGPDTSGGADEWAELSVLARSDRELALTRLPAVAAATDNAGLFWVADILENLILQGIGPTSLVGVTWRR